VIALGTDIVEVDRIRGMIERWEKRFLLRIFTLDEIRYCQRQVHPPVHFAGRFAAKEAVKKALYAFGVEEPMAFRLIEIKRDTVTGIPSVVVSACTVPPIRLSISHTHTYAVATALIESDP
jgi:holo-[acyl-carrier protein] synthase